MRLYIVRHADPDYSIDGLTPAGHLEAQALAERFAALGLDQIYASPLGRARRTMQYTADRLQMPHAILDWTAELNWPRIHQPNPVDPAATTYCVWDVHGHTVRSDRALPGYENWHTFTPFEDPHYRQAFGELAAASDAFFATLGFERQGGSYRVMRENRQRVAVFCHGGFGLTWLAHLLAIPLPLVWSGFFLSPSSVTTILFDERQPGIAVPRCLGLADVSHLYAAGLPVQPSGIKANVD